MRFLLPYAQLVRLPNTFTVLADILLGALATGFLSQRGQWFLASLGNSLPDWLRKMLPASFSSGTDIASVGAELGQWIALACLLVASISLYWSGMIWNDYFDVDQDRKERPDRPLASGRVPLRTAKYLAISLMVGGLLLAFAADRLTTGRWVAFPIAAALGAAIFLYDGLLKETFAGPIAMGLCRSLNILLGLSIMGV